MSTKKSYRFKGLLRIISGLSLLILMSLMLGCETKKEDTEPADKIQHESVQKEVIDSAAIKAAENAMKEAHSLVGTWKGKFDGRATTLKITEQDGNLVKGKITINYREVINQDVSGEFNPETMNVILNDLLRSRYMGTYKGKLSADMNNFSGIFTMKVDKKNMSFNLTKEN